MRLRSRFPLNLRRKIRRQIGAMKVHQLVPSGTRRRIYTVACYMDGENREYYLNLTYYFPVIVEQIQIESPVVFDLRLDHQNYELVERRCGLRETLPALEFTIDPIRATIRPIKPVRGKISFIMQVLKFKT